MDIYFVTTNNGKFTSAQRRLLRYGHKVVQARIEIDEPEHTNDSRTIAKAKCVAALREVPGPVLCEDGGFFVNALGGEPGVKAKGYLTTSNAEGLSGAERLLFDLEGREDRRAYFLNILAYMEMGGEPAYFEKKLDGLVTYELQGPDLQRSWSPLARVFIPEGYGKTLAAMSEDEYFAYADLNSNFVGLAAFLRDNVT